MSSSRPKLPPGPHGLWSSLANVREQMRDPLGINVRGQQRYGDIVLFRMGTVRVFLLSHPDYVKYVLADRVQNFPKPGHGARSALLGQGLFRSDGEYWRRQRRMVQPAFSRDRLAGWGVTTAVESTQEMLERWEARARDGASFNVAQDMSELTRAMMSRLVFTEDLVSQPGSIRDTLARIMHLHTHRAAAVFARLKVPLPAVVRWKRQFHGAIAELDTSIHALIARRRQQPAGEDDVLAMMMATRDPETGEGMSDEQLRDEAVNLFVAGHEATATTLAWTWYALGRAPEVEARVRDEVAQVVGDRVPTAQELFRLKYTSRVLDEVLRLYPAAWTLARENVQPDQIGGYDIPAKSLVTSVPYILHRHPAYWEQPDVFDPDRFTPERSAGRPRYCYMPFGGGQRQCIGDRLALLQILVALTLTVQRFRVELVSDAPAIPEATSTLRPRGGLQVRLSPIRDSRPRPVAATGS
ncbi:cytochrome P450 [Corallococcus llansteffanensis]|uniref:Cytochrome P450 n=1 Tax=Corallococcus llansteffanensis TaxID=2316731 RepID=A0A3A8Q2T0_9BACT|nr:cytochrome P450 [Corallococcus llansteffanensis]RKH63066.1 cytochrome P450 [Corallococcus llansteffanensis]